MTLFTRDELLSHVAAQFASQPYRWYPVLQGVLEGTLDELRARPHGDTVVARSASSLTSLGITVGPTVGDVMDVLALSRDHLQSVFGFDDCWQIEGREVVMRLQTFCPALVHAE